MVSTVQFMENFIKERIIKEFAAEMILMENRSLDYVEGLSDPFLTFYENDEKSRKFALTNVCFWDPKALHGEKVIIDGIIADDGLINISGYSRDYSIY